MVSSVSATSRRGESEHLAEDEHRALPRRQVLQCRDEGKLDGLALLVASLGRRVAVRDAQPLVRVRLDPHRLDERLAGIPLRGGRRAVVDRKNALGPPGDHVQTDIGRDPVEPRAGRAWPPNPARPRQAREAFLQGVLGVLERAQHAVAVGVKPGLMALDDAAKGVLVAAANGVEHSRSCSALVEVAAISPA